MLFWKWLSDNWSGSTPKAVADFRRRREPEVEADYHRFAIPRHPLGVTTKTANLGAAINKALGAIEQASPTPSQASLVMFAGATGTPPRNRPRQHAQ